MKFLHNKLLTFSILTIGITGLLAMPVHAVNVITDTCKGANASATLCDTQKDNVETQGFATNLTNTLLFILGIISVISIIIGGITYITSNGDASKTKKAKDIILYSVVGLVVALMAWGIVSYVAQRFGGTTPQNTNQQATP